MSAVAGVVQGLAVAATGAVLGFWSAGRSSGDRRRTAGRARHPLRWAVARGEMYGGRCARVWRAVLDATWSSLNTAAAALYYGVHRLTGNTHNPALTRRSGAIWLDRGVVTKYATTIG